jgi:NitT/TauT family transport system substrate-binding protein
MYNFKKALTVLLVIALMFAFTACQKQPAPVDQPGEQEPQQKTLIRVATLKGPTGMGMVHLMESNEEGNTALDYEFEVLGSPDDLVGKIISGEVDVATVPTNLAMVLYNRTQGQIQLAAVNTLGVLYLLENGDSIQSVEDLKGKTVFTTGKGASPDYMLRNILKKNNLEEDKDVILEYKLQHTELAAAMAAGDVKIGLLPQPHVTTAMMRNKDLRIALDLTQEWKKVMGENSKLIMGTLIVQKSFAQENKEAFNKFLDEYKESVAFVNSKQQEAAALMEKFEILPNAQVALRAIPYSSIVFIDAMEAKEQLDELYQILFEFDPRSVGGKLADGDFFYKR